MIPNLIHRKSYSFQPKINEVNVLRELCTIDSFEFTDNTNLSDCDILEDFLHLSCSGWWKLADIFIGDINKNLEKSSFWQNSVSSSKHGSVSTSQKSPGKKAVYNCHLYFI